MPASPGMTLYSWINGPERPRGERGDIANMEFPGGFGREGQTQADINRWLSGLGVTPFNPVDSLSNNPSGTMDGITGALGGGLLGGLMPGGGNLPLPGGSGLTPPGGIIGGPGVLGGGGGGSYETPVTPGPSGGGQGGGPGFQPGPLSQMAYMMAGRPPIKPGSFPNGFLTELPQGGGLLGGGMQIPNRSWRDIPMGGK